jgi:2,3-bisphosphoglycerate-dependent phosphoglycerate mutase
MQLYFIRHGQSANNALWDATGASIGRSDDPELTAIGKQQAQLLATYLAHGGNRFGFTHLYTSLMIRSIETALAVSEALGLPVHSWEDLHETGGIFLEDENGELVGQPGKNRAHFEATYPALTLHESLNTHGWWSRPFEEFDQHPIRAQRVLAELLEVHGGSDDVVAVVSHGNFYRHLMAALLRMSDPQAFFFGMHNSAISRIDFPTAEGEIVVIQYQNRVDHLPPKLIT